MHILVAIQYVLFLWGQDLFIKFLPLSKINIPQDFASSCDLFPCLLRLL